MKPPALELEGTPIEVLQRQLLHSEIRMRHAARELENCRQAVCVARDHFRTWCTTVDALRAHLRKLQCPPS